MTSRPRYADGEWNFICDLCGKQSKSSASMLTWDKKRVCARHKEYRNPLDLQRAHPPELPIPWSRPNPPDQFVVSSFRLLKEDGSQLLQEDGISLILRT